MTDTKGIAIEVSNLAKAFDQVVAVAGVNFSVQAGELFGFLGPNGAGKTTTINMLTGLCAPRCRADPDRRHRLASGNHVPPST